MRQRALRVRRQVRHDGARRRAFVRFTLWAVAVLVLANTVVFSSASFTSTSHNPGNVFSSGALLLLNAEDGQVVVSAAALRPGQSQEGTLTLTNAGTVPGDVGVEGVGLSDTPTTAALSAVLTLTIADVASGTELWSGTLDALTTAPLGMLAPGEGRQYRVTVAYPSGAADAALQGAQTTLTLRFSGISL